MRGLPPFIPLSAAANLFLSLVALPPRFPISERNRRTGEGRGSFFVFVFIRFFVCAPVDGVEVFLILLGLRVGAGLVTLAVSRPLVVFNFLAHRRRT